MITPTRLEVLDHVAAHFGMPRTAVLELFKTPTHPAAMRDELAAFAMQGILANPTTQGVSHATVAIAAYQQADAMLGARK